MKELRRQFDQVKISDFQPRKSRPAQAVAIVNSILFGAAGALGPYYVFLGTGDVGATLASMILGMIAGSGLGAAAYFGTKTSIERCEATDEALNFKNRVQAEMSELKRDVEYQERIKHKVPFPQELQRTHSQIESLSQIQQDPIFQRVFAYFEKAVKKEVAIPVGQ